jgi:hypothetical protein
VIKPVLFDCEEGVAILTPHEPTKRTLHNVEMANACSGEKALFLGEPRPPETADPERHLGPARMTQPGPS